MKYLSLALLAFAAAGCGHNEFDVSPAQVSQRIGASKPASLDHVHLPLGLARQFKKGEQLPDGTIANENVKISSDGQ